MTWKCHDDLSGEVISGEPLQLEVTLDGKRLYVFDVAKGQVLGELVATLGHHLVQASGVGRMAEPAEAREAPEPPTPGKADPPADEVLARTDASTDHWSVAKELDRGDVADGVTSTRDEEAPPPFDVSDASAVAAAATEREGALLAAEALLLDEGDEVVWTPRRVADECGMTLADARAVLAKVRRERGTR